MPHRDKFQKCYIDLGMHLEWLNCTEDNDYLHSFDPSTIVAVFTRSAYTFISYFRNSSKLRVN